ncbi:multidrug efflux SMR transporter [Brevundimonas sp.]|uniref:DMT family transporter n=1 Tax=Brevundimonas sp. TaxID=1871086 RepID=UPI0028A966B5|nr:multidrug efflux SMR transporter [Brevundimonas sp.]
MAWVYLFAAGVLEVVWAFLMKASAGFTRPWPTVGMVVFMIGSFGLLSLSMRTLPLGTAYAIWTGIGAVGAFAVGALVLGEPPTPLRIAGVALVASGLIVLKLASSH